MELLTDPLSEGIMQRALLEAFLLGIVCGPVGVWVVAYRSAYAAESLAHAMLPGLVGAELVGAPLLAGAAAGAGTGAAGIAAAGRDERVGTDTSVAVVVTTMVGLGALLALSPDASARIGDLLFGDLLGVTDGDLAAAGAMSAALLALMVAGHRRLAVAAFDPVGARALGVSVPRVQFLVLLGLAAAVVIAVQGIGNLLVVALLLAPGAAALAVARSLGGALVLAAILGAAAGIVGLYASYHLETAAGATVALTALALYAVVATAPRLSRRRSRHGNGESRLERVAR